MKNFTGKVTDVDNNGNPIKKKSSGKNGKKSGFKKPAAVKKSSGKKPLKDITTVMTKKPVRKIVEYYYFFDEEMDARKLQSAVGENGFEKADIWPELNLMEVEMNFDSLIFQNAEECFIDPADQQWFEDGVLRQSIRSVMIPVILRRFVKCFTTLWLPSAEESAAIQTILNRAARRIHWTNSYEFTADSVFS